MGLNPVDKKELNLMIDNLKIIYDLMNKNQRLFYKEIWFVENIILKLKHRIYKDWKWKEFTLLEN